MTGGGTSAFPVPVVRLIARRADGKVLLLRRRQGTHSGGSWCLPGGKVDYGVTVEEAARRELAEETGLECAELRFLFYQDSLPPGPGEMHGINLYFECEVAGSVLLNDESSEYAWIGPAELDRYGLAFRNAEGLRRYWGRSG